MIYKSKWNINDSFFNSFKKNKLEKLEKICNYAVAKIKYIFGYICNIAKFLPFFYMKIILYMNLR